jgi:hypothetical protein
MQRRSVIQSGAWFALALLLAAPSRVLASNQQRLHKPLINALMQINRPVTRLLANRLDDSLSASNSYNLHLRSASLTTDDAQLIAKALRRMHKSQNLRLMSFSMSYNPDIGDLGVGELLNALPDNTTELGLVGCELDDNASIHIVEFIQRSKTLRMVCVEDNKFSTDAKISIRSSTKHLLKCVTIL